LAVEAVGMRHVEGLSEFCSYQGKVIVAGIFTDRIPMLCSVCDPETTMIGTNSRIFSGDVLDDSTEIRRVDDHENHPLEQISSGFEALVQKQREIKILIAPE